MGGGIEKALESKLNKNDDHTVLNDLTVNSLISNETSSFVKGWYSHQTSAGGDIAGYVKFCQLEIISVYANYPMMFNIMKRGLVSGCNVELHFMNSATMETYVNHFIKDNNNSEFDIIAVPFGNSKNSNVFGLYVYKGARNDWINFKVSIQDYANNYIKITWENEFIENKVDIPNITNATHATLRDLAVNNIIAANYIGTNLLVGCNAYTKDNPLSITATKDDHYIIIGTVPLIKGETYTVNFETDGNFGQVSGTDTVEFYIMNPNNTVISGTGDGTTLPKTFVSNYTGIANFRLDVNKNGAIHKFWNLKVEKGIHATDYVPNLEEMITDINSLKSEVNELKETYTQEIEKERK